MSFLILTPFLLQGMIMAVDEFYFHRKRGLPLWERIGHPMDTLSIISCYAVSIYNPPDKTYVPLFIGLAIFSSILITKDEIIHHRYCTAMEQWLHAFLFILHPIVLFLAGWIWLIHTSPEILNVVDSEFLFLFLKFQLYLAVFFLFYQLFYWQFLGKKV